MEESSTCQSFKLLLPKALGQHPDRQGSMNICMPLQSAKGTIGKDTCRLLMCMGTSFRLCGAHLTGAAHLSRRKVRSFFTHSSYLGP